MKTRFMKGSAGVDKEGLLALGNRFHFMDVVNNLNLYGFVGLFVVY